MTPQSDLPTGTKLSLLWLFAILNIVFRDLHELTMASTIEEILTGHLNGAPMSEGLLVVGAFLVELLLLGFLLSSLLRPKLARWINLVLAPIAILGTLAAQPSDPDDYIFAVIEIATFCAIWWIARGWTPAKPHLETGLAS
ncbi:MAG: hypothetical protein JXR13_17305 [Thalassovita sp.]